MAQAIDHPQLLTLYEAADRLDVSHWVVRNEVNSGAIPALRVGQQFRVDPAEVTLNRDKPEAFQFPPAMSVKLAAHILQVNPQTIKRLISNGVLPQASVGNIKRILRDDLIEALTFVPEVKDAAA